MKRLLSFLFLMLLPLMASADAVEIDGIFYEFDNESQEASVVKNPNRYAGDVVIPEKVSFDGTEYTVTAIEGAAFGYCDGLTSVIIPKSVTFIGGYAFSKCKSLTAIVLPDALERIANHAFFMSENLSTLNIPAGVTYIGECAFSGCPITDYTIPRGIAAIYQSTFNGTAVSSVVIPNKVESIGEWAFRNCSNLESVVIPAAVTSIGEKAFGDCDNLTSVTVYIKSPLAIPEDAFSNRTNATLMVPVGCKEDYLAADYWKEFKEIVEVVEKVPEPYAVLSENNTKLTFYYDSNKEAMDGMDVGPFIYAGGDRATTSWFDQRATITTVVFDESFADCTSITNTAYWFYGCNKLVTISGLENLNMGNVEKMDCMFCGCSSIETLDLSSFNTENVKSFFSVFTNCSSLTSLNVSKFNTENATDMKNMFNGCSSLTSLDVSNFNTGNVTDMYGMFYKCSSLTSLDLSHFDMSKVTDIGIMFMNCSALTTIYCNDAWSCEQSRSMFSGCTSLVGAISFDGDMTDATCANPTTGYFTTTGGLPGFEVGDVFTVGRMTYVVTSTNPLEAQVSSGKNWTPAIDKSTEGAVVIPSSVIGEDGNTYAVTSIGSNAFVECSGITSVAIPGSVTSIGVSAFMKCSGLTSVIIPDGVTSIDAQAFSGCSGLTSLTIGNSVTTLGKNAFSGCIGLTSVTIPKSVTRIGGMDKYTGGFQGAFPGCSGIASIKVEEGNPVYDSREDCNAIIETATNTLIWGCKNTVIPDDVASIGDNAFLNCTGLTSVSIPTSVTSIQAGAFEGCTGLTSITIPNSVTSLGTNRLIGGLTFIYLNEIGGGSNLTSVTVEITDPSVAPGDNTVFTDVENATLYVPKGCKAVFEASDSWNNFKEIVETDYYPPYEVDDVFTVDGMTFMVTSIEPLEVRVGKGNLTGMNGSPAIDVSTEGTVVIPSSVTGNDGKSYAVTSIGAGAFASCSGVTSVIIPNSVTAIAGGFDWGGSAFAGGAFENCGLTTLTIPSNVTSIGQGAFSGCSNLVSIVVEGGNTVYDSRNNCNAVIVKETNALIAGCKNTVIPDGVTRIGNGSFSGCKGLTSLELPSSVTYIGQDGFKGCSDLTSIGISGVTSIDYGAFEGCSALTSIVIPEGVTGIWQYTFYGCSSLTTITIPKGMKWIGRNTYTGFFHNSFWGCSSLTDFYCYAEEVPEVNAKVFEGSNIANATLYVPAGCSDAYSSAEGWKDFKEIKEFVNDESATYIIEDDKTVTITNEIISTEKEIEIPAGVAVDGETYPVTGIAENAFANNTILEQVTIPETIEKIGDAAFAGCTSLKFIYSYAKEPIPLGSAKAKVRTRADGEEISASTVFAEVDKETCVLYVPAGSADKYEAAYGWSEFKNIVEMDDILGDANNDGKVDADDIDVITRYIMKENDEVFIFKNADVNGDEKINAADIVEVVNIIKADK